MSTGQVGSVSTARGTLSASAPVPIHVLPPIVNDDTTPFPTVTGLYSQLHFSPFTPPPVTVKPCVFRAETVAEFTTYYTGLLSAIPGGYDEAWVVMRLRVPGGCAWNHPQTSVVQAGLMYRIKNTFGIWNGGSWTMVWPPQPHYIPYALSTTTYRNPGRDDGKG